MTSPRPLGPRALAERRPSSPPDGRLLLLVPDPHARFAAVELDAGFVADEVREHGYGLCTYVFCWSPERTALSEVDESLRRYADRYGDLRLRPDFASLTALPDGTSAVVCDAEWPSGEPVAAAPRQALAAQLRTLEELGFVPSVGIEHEVVFTGADGAPMTGHGVDYALGGTESSRRSCANCGPMWTVRGSDWNPRGPNAIPASTSWCCGTATRSRRATTRCCFSTSCARPPLATASKRGTSPRPNRGRAARATCTCHCPQRTVRPG